MFSPRLLLAATFIVAATTLSAHAQTVAPSAVAQQQPGEPQTNEREQAINVARKIKFIPAELNSKPVSQFVRVEYNFNIY